MEDLAAWTGRLAYDDPRWSLSSGPRQPVRPPEDIAAEDVPLMIAAAHQACDTLTSVSHAEGDQIQMAARAGRIMVPTRSLPERYDIPYPFVRAPQERIEQLLSRYGQAGRASHRAVDAVGEVAESVRAPSRTLTLARAAVAGRSDRGSDADLDHVPEASRDAGAGAAPGMVERTLLDLGVTDPDLLARGTGIDQDADRLLVEAAGQNEIGRRQPAVVPDTQGESGRIPGRAPRSGDSRSALTRRTATLPEREEPEPEP